MADPITRLGGAYAEAAARAAIAWLTKHRPTFNLRDDTNLHNLLDRLNAKTTATLPKLLEDAKTLHLGGYDGWLNEAFLVHAAGAGIEAAKEVA